MRYFVILALMFLTLLPTPSLGATLEERLTEVSPAVGALYAQTSSGSLEFLCTVTVIGQTDGRSQLLTAAHCVQKNVAYLVTLDGRLFHAARVWKVPKDSIDPQKFRRQYGEPETDLALFQTDTVLPVQPVTLGDDAELQPGRPIVTVGYPLGVTKIRYTGMIAGRYERPGADIDGYLILQIFGAPGSSGSAVIEEATGRVIGVLVSAKQSIGTPVIFAVPISYLRFLGEVPTTGKK